ncbi:MAG: prepilin-type N-terminal cleavage/methylation domain-containing protein [Methylotenera sp.]|nr:prepilin-type N-terminal cleavage/methylation domain-containing protein [Oligoflexia bacterium]
MFRKISGNQSGFSLVEVMLVSAIMVIIVMGMAEIFVGQAKSQKSAQSKANALQVQISIQSAASDPAAILRSSVL